MHVVIVGAGKMAVEYAKVLKALEVKFTTITRGLAKANIFENATGIKPFLGGLEKFFSEFHDADFTHAIIAVNIESLMQSSMFLLNKGIKNILLEKPGSKNISELSVLAETAKKESANVFIAYNRRFYTSVAVAKEIIQQDNGVESFHFEFNEFSHQIAGLDKHTEIKQMWFLANSTHVADMAFFLCGKPILIKSFVSGSLPWHDAASIFTGTGKSTDGTLFTYNANWNAPGRWGIEIMTNHHRLIFRPLEKLSIQSAGKLQTEQVPLNDEKDISYKPGLYMQVKSWLQKDYGNLCTINEQLSMMKWYYQIANYNMHETAVNK